MRAACEEAAKKRTLAAGKPWTPRVRAPILALPDGSFRVCELVGPAAPSSACAPAGGGDSDDDAGGPSPGPAPSVGARGAPSLMRASAPLVLFATQNSERLAYKKDWILDRS